MRLAACTAFLLFVLPTGTIAQEESHAHPAPEKLGRVSFPTSCAPEVQTRFERAVALLHSFAYTAADEAFREVSAADPACAMAHWGRAMTRFHQLWTPLPASELERGKAEVERALQTGTKSEREREYIAALAPIFREADSQPYPARARRYEEAMRALAEHNPNDAEAQIFYALALLATASPDDKTHQNQKKAAEILEPLYRSLPEHPGIAHYLIHAYDNAEMAPRGLPAARAYAQIAPSAPHALHMPSHIFTRLGMWNESIASNLAARVAAHQQGDTGEELHAMDYLVYAYLQTGRSAEAARVIQELPELNSLPRGDFKVTYSATAMQVRYAIERRQWAEAMQTRSADGAPPHVAALAVWARAIGNARGGNPAAAGTEIETLRGLQDQLQRAGNPYWAGQVHIQVLEASAWVAQTTGKIEQATTLLRDAADQEDAVEKLPVTPGPIIPAREQLGDLLLQLRRPQQALAEFESTLISSPGRRGALDGALQAAEQAGAESKARLYRLALQQGK
jgi:tetratricopeptide (TPR) repeat protein